MFNVRRYVAISYVPSYKMRKILAMNKKVYDLSEVIFLICLFLFSVSFMNMAGQFLTIVIIFCICKGYLKFDLFSLLLILYSILYFFNYMIFFPVNYKDIIIYLLAPWGSYLVCYQMASNSKDSKFNIKIFFTLLMGFFIHGLLNVFTSINYIGLDVILNSPKRISHDFWRQEIISVTGCSLYFTPLASLAIGILFFSSKKIYKLFGLICIVMCAWANILYANRTFFYILIILISVGIVYSLKISNFLGKDLVCLICTAIVLWMILAFDWFGVRSSITNLKVFHRLTGMETGRLSLWISYLSSDWWKYPLGGNNVFPTRVHNMYLDTLRLVGIVPFLLQVILTIMSLKFIKKFYKINMKYNLMFIFSLLGIFIHAMVEPVIEANPYYFIIMIMIVATIKATVDRTEKQGENK